MQFCVKIEQANYDRSLPINLLKVTYDVSYRQSRNDRIEKSGELTIKRLIKYSGINCISQYNIQLYVTI